MAEFTGIIFNERQMPDFVRVLNIHHSILPPISQNLINIGGRAGAYDFGNTIGTREITVDIAVVAPEENVMPSMLEELSEWLIYDEAKELILGDNPYRYYLAKVTGDTNIDEQFIVGEGSITFVCTEPYIFGQERSVVIPPEYQGEPMELINTGSADTFPYMSFDITKDLTSFSVVSGDEYIDLGTPFEVDTDESKKVDAGGYVLIDYLKSLSGWNKPSSVPQGTISGSYEVVDNIEFRQAGLNYGTGTGWHGASAVKNLAQATTNFDSNMYFRINTNATSKYIGTLKLKTDLNQRVGGSTKYRIKKVGKKGQTFNVVGRASSGWYKLENGYYTSNVTKYATFTPENVGADKLGKLQYILNDANGKPLMIASVTDGTNKSRSLTANVTVYNGGTKYAILNQAVPSKYLDLDGYWNIKRSNNVWFISLYASNDAGKYTRIFYKKWTDTKKTYSRAISQAQLLTQAYSKNTACYMSLKEITIKTLDVEVKDDEIPLILRAGDVLEIDNETGAILRNGRPFYQYLNPSSSFIKLQSGSNGIAVYPADGFKNGSVSYVERYL